MGQSLTIYKASAGSGKTFALAVEYIALLLAHEGGHEYEHTLAVTFTNKATAEMKDRILSTLHMLAEGRKDGETRSYLHALRSRLEAMGTPMGDEMIRHRAGEALTAILHDYSHFRVETIDSFFQSVLRSLAHELGLESGLQIELGSDEVVSRAVDRVIEKMQNDNELQHWILNYVSEQMEQNERWDIRGQVKRLAGCIFDEAYQGRTEQERQAIDDQDRMSAFKRTLSSLQREALEQIKAAAMAFRTQVEDGPLGFERISHGGDYFLPFLDRLLEGRLDPPPSTSIRAAAEDSAALVKKAVRSDAVLMKEAARTSESLARLIALYDEKVADITTARLAARYLNPLRLLGRIEQEIGEVSAENNQFNLSLTPSLLSRLVRNEDAPFVFEKIGTQFHNVLIDEFQDTSHQQWENFKVLLLENQATGGNDLLVGDIKQSIYRWRGGDWEILRSVKDELSRLAPTEVVLDSNYRTYGNVRSMNNTFFPRAAAALDALAPSAHFHLADIYSDVCQQPGAGKEAMIGEAYVRLYPKNAPYYEQEMVDEMIEKIRQLTSMGLSPSEIAILVRKNKNGARLLKLFHTKAPDIKLVSDEAFLLGASTAVQMIVAALHTLQDKEGANPIPLRYLMLHYQADILSSPLTAQQVATMNPAEALPTAFYEQRDELSRMPLHLLAERLYDILGLEKMEGQSAYLFTFFDELQNHLRTNPSDIHTFLNAWDETLSTRPIPGGDIDGVRILTIHKSKGLQFHTVLLPYMDWSVEEESSFHETHLWCRTTKEPFGELGALPITLRSEMVRSHFAADYREEHLQRRVDALNMIYVAFTRAKCNLYVWGATSKKDTAISISGDVIRHGLPTFDTTDHHSEEGDDQIITYSNGTPLVAPPTSPHASSRLSSHTEEDTDGAVPSDPTPVDVKMVTCASKLDFQQSNQSKRFIHELGEEQTAKGEQSYLEIGKLMHYVLSQIEHRGQVDKVLRKCQAEGLIADPKMMSLLRSRIMHGLAGQRVSQWFDPENEVFNECGIASIDPATGAPHTLRPDRVVARDGKITVIDFKFGHEEESHHTQVRSYMTLLGQMYPQHVVEGYLWYIYSGKCKEVKA